MRWLTALLLVSLLAVLGATAHAALLPMMLGGGSAAQGGGGGEGIDELTPTFAMDCGASGVDFPDCNFPFTDVEDFDLEYDRFYVDDGSGPCGRPFVRFDFAEQAVLVSAAAWGWQIPHADWAAMEGGMQLPQGTIRYLRVFVKVFPGMNWEPTTGGNPGNKFLDFAQHGDQGDAEPTRAVMQVTANPGDPGQFDIQMFRGGGGGPTVEQLDAGVGAWIPIQFKLVSSSTPTAMDGELHMYLGAANASESTPTDSVTGFDWKTDGWAGADLTEATMTIGSTMDSLGVGKELSFGVADFQYDNEFNTTWGNCTGSLLIPSTFFDRAANDDEYEMRLAA